MFKVLLFALLIGAVSGDECNVDGKQNKVAYVPVVLQCGSGRTIENMRVRARRPGKGGGSRWIVEGNTGSLTIKPGIMVEWKCSGESEKRVERFFTDPLEPMVMSCIAEKRLTMRTEEPVTNGDKLAPVCIGRQRCSRDVTVRYTVRFGCRKHKRALQCCDISSDDDELEDMSKSACGLELTCGCCEKEDGLNLQQCGDVQADNGSYMTGISGESELDNETDDDTADNENPGTDEDGCHVRKAKITKSGEEVCVPGNLADILRVINRQLVQAVAAGESAGARCQLENVLSPSCRTPLNKALTYMFEVTILMVEDDVEGVKTYIKEAFEAEFMENPCIEITESIPYGAKYSYQLRCTL